MENNIENPVKESKSKKTSKEKVVKEKVTKEKVVKEKVTKKVSKPKKNSTIPTSVENSNANITTSFEENTNQNANSNFSANGLNKMDLKQQILVALGLDKQEESVNLEYQAKLEDGTIIVSTVVLTTLKFLRSILRLTLLLRLRH